MTMNDRIEVGIGQVENEVLQVVNPRSEGLSLR